MARITSPDIASARRALAVLASIELPINRPDFDNLGGWLDYLAGFVDRVEAQQRALDAGGVDAAALRPIGERQIPKLDTAIKAAAR